MAFDQRKPYSPPQNSIVSEEIKNPCSKLVLSNDTVDPELFNQTAELIAVILNQAKDKFNKPTQIRRFYDELASWDLRVKSEDDFRKYEAFIRMMNAKAAYAKGRELVDANFEYWFKALISAVKSEKGLKNGRLHFEAVLGFLKGLRG
jgi:CRISPR-associated protein Csm2